MSDFLDWLIAFVTEHQTLAYLLAFLMAALESVAVVGLAVPGSTFIVALSALVPTGAVGMWPLLIWSTLGAVIGDGLSYWLGYRYHRAITRHWPFNRYLKMVERGRDFFQRHGGKSVFIGRFVPPVRGVIPFVGGVMRMPPPRFLVFNVLSAAVWAPAHVLPGALLGTGLTMLGALTGRLTILLIVIAGVLWLVVVAVRLVLRHGLPALGAAQDRLLRWAEARDTWLSRQVEALLSPARPETGVLVLLALTLLGAAWTFFGILEDVVSGDPLVRVDSAIFHVMQGLRTPWADAVMVWITTLGDAAVSLAITAVVLLWLVSRRAWRAAGYWLGAVIVAALSSSVVKLALHRPRPATGFAADSSFAFPSGHATMSAAIYGLLALFVAREVRPPWRGLVVAVAALLIALISLSRLYLGAHWMSDVGGGVAIGIAWVALLGMAYLRHSPQDIGARGLLAAVAVTLLVAGGAYASIHHADQRARYAGREQPRMIAATDWWTGGWRQLPMRRTDLVGELEEPFAVQWAGPLQGLLRHMVQAGWRVPVAWGPETMLAWVAASPDPTALPVLPKLQDGRLPVRTLIRPAAASQFGGRLVLRVWPTAVVLGRETGPPMPLWLVSVVEERLRRRISLVTVVRTKPDSGEALDPKVLGLDRAGIVWQRVRPAENGGTGDIFLVRQGAPVTPP